MRTPREHRAVCLPVVKRGRRSAAEEGVYEAEVVAFCDGIKEIASRLDFRVSARGFAYILENAGAVTKGDFDRVEKVINGCRKDGHLPIDITAEDESRGAEGVQDIDPADRGAFLRWVLETMVPSYISVYTPEAFWDELDVYIEVVVEKIDLKGLFGPVCEEYFVPIANMKGWSDINSRALLMKRMQQWERRGKRCVLLMCGDHDPGGLAISSGFRKNLEDLTKAVGWDPENLEIVRFGLNADFIAENRLTWLDNLETGSGKHLDDPKHHDHFQAYVQDYLRKYGARKVEANALVVRVDEGRALMRETIEVYVPKSAHDSYSDRLSEARATARAVLPAEVRRWVRRLTL